ncbi:MAG TPA: hypothetical protein VN370_01465 [Desulfitobacteriaceae bacterium]|jgi:hypothetical protein|nr:hypothetical protein [Desulfitobacteriaceae bacterium]
MLNRIFFISAIFVVLVLITAGCSSHSSVKENSPADDNHNMAAMKDKSDAAKQDDSSAAKVDSTAAPTSNTKSANNEQVFEGWLMDKMSSDNKEPEKKTKECLLMSQMEESGYGVLVKQADNTFKFLKFDETGHKLAKENILNKTTKTENIKITVKGVVEGEVLKVSSIAEIN